jgi:hypothetical protein
MPAIREPQIRVGLSSNGVRQIEVYADTRESRDEALRAILRASSEIEALDSVLGGLGAGSRALAQT